MKTIEVLATFHGPNKPKKIKLKKTFKAFCVPIGAHNSKKAPHKAQRVANKARMKLKQRTHGYKQQTKNKLKDDEKTYMHLHEVSSGLLFIGM
jgi:hypothetical protein